MLKELFTNDLLQTKAVSHVQIIQNGPSASLTYSITLRTNVVGILSKGRHHAKYLTYIYLPFILRSSFKR